MVSMLGSFAPFGPDLLGFPGNWSYLFLDDIKLHCVM